jgi:hypothetical protein
MSINDRYRNVCKAHDHIVKCRTKEGKRIFVPRCGYVIIPSDKLLTARIKRNAYKVNREFNEWARKLWMYHAESASLEK